MPAEGALVIQGDALHLPLSDESVDLVVTSPPYFALRAYDAGPAQIGSEPTPVAYLEALWAATAEMARVLKPSGSMFVDLGDKYSTVGGGPPGASSGIGVQRGGRNQHLVGVKQSFQPGMPNKSLMLLPERYRVGCVDRLGLIARAVIVWDKPNGLPESVRDRVRRSHEDWVHLTRQPRYYSAIDEVREPYTPAGLDRNRYERGGSHTVDRGAVAPTHPLRTVNPGGSSNPLGKLPGSVWTIPSEPLRLPEHLGVDHYAAFPSEWPRRLILGWSPPNGTVLDPFSGTGTTVMVARALGRIGVGVDLSYDYGRAARWRVHHNAGKAISRTNLERQGVLA